MRIFNTPNYDFIRWRWHAIVISSVVILAGLGGIVQRGLPLGIDFSGGTILVVKFADAVSEDQIRNAIEVIPGEKVVQQYGDLDDHEILVRLPQMEATEEGANLSQGADQIVEAIQGGGLPDFEVISTEIVGPVIGADLQQKGIYATLASIIGITLYIAFRFRPSFALGAIAATFHDILVTLTFLTFFGYELSLNVVAAILTITGYSVNDTIVIFDRVRENLRGRRRDSLEHIVNTSVNQTLSRTVITAGTTFLAVASLFFFGGEVLHGFAFTMLVGIVSGTYSTIFIAAAIAIILSQKRRSTAVPASSASSSRVAEKARRAQTS